MRPEVLLGLDVGTTSVKTVAIDTTGRWLATAAVPLRTRHPGEGWAEQDPEELVRAAQGTLARVATSPSVRRGQVLGLGITNQRESTLAVDPSNGRALSPLLLWHDLRTLSIAEEFGKRGWRSRLWKSGGMPLTTYPSAPKIVWLLRNCAKVRTAVPRDRVRFLTVDAWIAYRLLGGARTGAPFLTDPSNASRTLLLDPETGRYDPGACRHFGVDREWLAKIVPSWGKELGTLQAPGEPLHGIPLLSLLGDQQASLLGLSSLYGGDAKVTLGTGAFLLAKGRGKGDPERSGYLRTVLWQEAGKDPELGIEGSVGAAGSFLDWLCGKGLRLFRDPVEMERLAPRARPHGGELFVPALCGLFAPHWNLEARGLLHGLDLSTRREDLARSAFEGLAHSIADVVEVIAHARGSSLSPLLVDGGVARSRLLLKLLAEYSGTTLRRCDFVDGTALGAALAAGYGSRSLPGPGRSRPRARSGSELIVPKGRAADRRRSREEWHRALAHAFLRTNRQGGPFSMDQRP